MPKTKLLLLPDYMLRLDKKQEGERPGSYNIWLSKFKRVKGFPLYPHHIRNNINYNDKTIQQTKFYFTNHLQPCWSAILVLIKPDDIL